MSKNNRSIDETRIFYVAVYCLDSIYLNKVLMDVLTFDTSSKETAFKCAAYYLDMNLIEHPQLAPEYFCVSKRFDINLATTALLCKDYVDVPLGFIRVLKLMSDYERAEWIANTHDDYGDHFDSDDSGEFDNYDDNDNYDDEKKVVESL